MNNRSYITYNKIRGDNMKKTLCCDVVEVHPQVVTKLKETMPAHVQYQTLSELFKMFADPTRLKIFSLLFQRELCVCDIAEILSMTHSAVSHQLSVLRQNRIIKYRREGKNIFYSLDDEHIQMIYNAGMEHIIESLHADR